MPYALIFSTFYLVMNVLANPFLSKLFMEREKVANIMKINANANLMAEAICSGLSSFDVEKTCNSLQAIFTLPQGLTTPTPPQAPQNQNQNKHNLPPPPVR